MRTTSAGRLGQALVAALVCLSFVLQQTLIPLHLSLNEHTLLAHEHGTEAVTHAPTHVGHGHTAADPLHVHAYEGIGSLGGLGLGLGSDAGSGRDDHDPHPAEDHLEQGIGELVVSLLGQIPLAEPPPVWTPPLAPAALEGVLPPEPFAAASPPPRGRAEPRAPPVSV